MGEQAPSRRKIRLHPTVTRFLLSSRAHAVNWNGHEVKHCFNTAIALAAAEANQKAHNIIIVQDYGFKEAMNMAHESLEYLKSVLGED
jgi:hypothetical protein